MYQTYFYICALNNKQQMETNLETNLNKPKTEIEYFETFGFFKDYFVDKKYIGSISYVEKDREHYGYYGRQKEVIQTNLILSNKKKIKAGTEVITELFPINGRIINNKK